MRAKSFLQSLTVGLISRYEVFKCPLGPFLRPQTLLSVCSRWRPCGLSLDRIGDAPTRGFPGQHTTVCSLPGLPTFPAHTLLPFRESFPFFLSLSFPPYRFLSHALTISIRQTLTSLPLSHTHATSHSHTYTHESHTHFVTLSTLAPPCSSQVPSTLFAYSAPLSTTHALSTLRMLSTRSLERGCDGEEGVSS